MNNLKFKQLLILPALFIAFTGCDDETIDPPADPVVTFNFSDPSTGNVYGTGDTVFINGMISFENDMHGYEVSIINTSHSDTMVFNKHEHSDGKMFHIHEHWVNNVHHHSDMKLIIDALTDHSGGKESKTINFHCHPN